MSSDKKSQSSLAQIKNKIKVVFLGDQSTGKTSIILQYIHGKFEENQITTVGIDFMAKNICANSINLRLQLWDTAGQERFRSLIPSYLKDATVTFIVFDITNRRSFQNVREWIELSSQSRKDKSISYLIGNKLDLAASRQVSVEEAEKFAKQEQLRYLQVSAKQNKNITKLFSNAAEQYILQAYADEQTIGNIEAIHQGYLSKMQQKSPTKPIQLKSAQAEPSNQKKKKTGCC